MSTPQYFPFLDLPKELRLMVYEYLPIQPIASSYPYINGRGAPAGHFTMIAQGITTGIIGTSDEIHAEAEAIIAIKRSQIRDAPARMLLNAQHLPRDGSTYDIITGITQYLYVIEHSCLQPSAESGSKIVSELRKYKTPWQALFGRWVQKFEEQRQRHSVLNVQIGIEVDTTMGSADAVESVEQYCNNVVREMNKYQPFHFILRLIGDAKSPTRIQDIKTRLEVELQLPGSARSDSSVKFTVGDMVDEKEFSSEWLAHPLNSV
ncbi:hypothetical protein FB567DRAFT_597346 [Paraphoma chrysanthemicola]|uniref:Uncharacterized protein n=1 Tax=Paraphoma chrysanthemicola TaxID=798071 RepID=A0A8K0VU64_9PLEO|nr:hypothetical protein FB567DRAFT_597346 [Paraphoma chrysanthemicola]